jgi:hypothetical protein
LGEFILNALVKRSVSEVPADAFLVVGFSCATLDIGHEQNRAQLQLPTEMSEYLDRHLPVSAKKAAVLTYYAELKREPAAIIITAALSHFHLVRLRQAEVARQLFLAGINCEEHARRPAPRNRCSLGDGVSRQH